MLSASLNKIFPSFKSFHLCRQRHSEYLKCCMKRNVHLDLHHDSLLVGYTFQLDPRTVNMTHLILFIHNQAKRGSNPMLPLGDFNARTRCLPDYRVFFIRSKNTANNCHPIMIIFLNEIHKVESYRVQTGGASQDIGKSMDIVSNFTYRYIYIYFFNVSVSIHVFDTSPSLCTTVYLQTFKTRHTFLILKLIKHLLFFIHTKLYKIISP